MLREIMEEETDKNAKIKAAQLAREIVKETSAHKQTQREAATERRVDETKLQGLLDWHPHKNQQLILDSKSKDIVINAGRRFGKSSLCGYVALRALLENKNVLVVAPTYELTRRVSDYLRRWIGQSFKNEMTWTERPLPHVATIWGAFLDCRSGEQPDQMLGKEYDLVIIDECSRIQRKVHDIYIVPASGREIGKYFYISTPFGENWFHEKWTSAKETDGAFQFKSLDNPFFGQDKWEEAKKKLPKQIFEQEYEASFLPDAAAVFRNIDDIVKDSSLQDVLPNHNYVMGVDLGKHEDFTVITVLDKYNNNVVYWDRFKQIDYSFQKTRIKAIAKKYNNARIVIDSTGVGEPIWEDMTRDHLFVEDFKFTNKSKKELVEKLSIYIEQKYIWIPPEQQLIDELKSFGYRLTDAGNIVYRAPQGLYDDSVYSLALAIWGLRGKANPSTALDVMLAKTNKKNRKFQYL